MVRAIPINPWRWADVFERVRPGFAVSAALHIGLFFVLAYFLAFHPGLPVQEPKTEETVTVIEAPKPPPPAMIEIPKVPTFKPMVTRPIKGLDVKVPPFVLPPVDDTRIATQQTTTEPPAPAVIINPKPIYRGGLDYPERAAEANRSGYVIFSFIIRKDGSVGDPQVIEEVPDGYGFATAAKKAFPKWRFDPKLVDGKPVDAPAQIRVTFQLN